MTNLPQGLEKFTTTATVEDIDNCLKSLDPKKDKSLINFWLDLRLTIKHKEVERSA